MDTFTMSALKYLSVAIRKGEPAVRVEDFDEDFEPIGPKLRRGLSSDGLILVDHPYVIPTIEGYALLDRARDPQEGSGSDRSGSE